MQEDSWQYGDKEKADNVYFASSSCVEKLKEQLGAGLLHYLLISAGFLFGRDVDTNVREYSHECGCYTILSLVTIYMHCYSTS